MINTRRKRVSSNLFFDCKIDCRYVQSPLVDSELDVRISSIMAFVNLVDLMVCIWAAE